MNAIDTEVLRKEEATRVFDEDKALHELKHFLPEQAALKDFIHQNTLHFFQNLKFHEATRNASEILGYRVALPLSEFRSYHAQGRIRDQVLERVIAERMGPVSVQEWKEKAVHKKFAASPSPRIGSLRANWKKHYRIDLDSLVHPLLFRILCSYLDQGISMWGFPVSKEGFLASIAEIEKNTFSSFFKTERARKLFLSKNWDVTLLLETVVGDESLYSQYLFDQQFAHQGWSGIVSVIEDAPSNILDSRKISVRELIVLELIMEIDALELNLGKGWTPLAERLDEKPLPLFAEVVPSELSEVMSIWQEAFEWSYYDEVLEGLAANAGRKNDKAIDKTFQAVLCIDDREVAFRIYLEKLDRNCEIYNTPGFFNVEFMFQPEHGKFYTKLCPAPVTPKYLIKEKGRQVGHETDAIYSKLTHTLFRGWLITQTLGLWSAIKLFANIFKPSMSPATASSFKHHEQGTSLSVLNENAKDIENNLQVGFNLEEMVTRTETLLKSIGIVKEFAPIVYAIGHGSSSVNNPHYAAYDCGACSGRAGSVNSRSICFMLNNPDVRKELAQRGIDIPDTTQFIGGLHDTTRDEVVFFDEDSLSEENRRQHITNLKVFHEALDQNAKERSRRFESIDTRMNAEAVHEKVRMRSVSLFEPRPELNHATNTLCIVGRREMTRDLFLDRRAFLNSYDYRIDPVGKLLFGIMKPLGPVCGGINLEYFFSRVDNQKLGAGTKLPHNVMGLIGVANGADGDLRPGLPSQMIEIHDPIRLMIIVEHFPDVVLSTIKKTPEVYEWFINEWVRLVVIHPESGELYFFKDGYFNPYNPLPVKIETVDDITQYIESSDQNLPVSLLS